MTRISDDECELILKGLNEATLERTGAALVRPGALLNHPRLILSGWACVAVILADGRRQLLDFALPGDLVGFGLNANSRAKATVVCLTPIETVKIPALASGRVETTERPSGTLAILRAAQDQFEDHLINQIVRNGCQTAAEKLCSLLLELYARLARVGVAEQDSFELPISQVVIAEALGLSTVHVNRTVQHLKRTGVIQSDGHRLTILNWAALRKLAGELRLPNVADS